MSMKDLYCYTFMTLILPTQFAPADVNSCKVTAQLNNSFIWVREKERFNYLHLAQWCISTFIFYLKFVCPWFCFITSFYDSPGHINALMHMIIPKQFGFAWKWLAIMKRIYKKMCSSVDFHLKTPSLLC